MSYNSSPPSEALEFRGKTLTPVSPKPLHFPSPSNIPILEKQMDPVFHDTVLQMTGALSTDMQPTDSYDQAAADPHLSSSVVNPENEISHLQDAGVVTQPADATAGGVEFADPMAFGLGNENVADKQDNAAIQDMLASNFQNGAAAPSDAFSALMQTDENSAQSSILDPAAQEPAVALNVSNSLISPGSASTQFDSIGESSGGVNLQALLDNLSSSTANAAAYSNSTPADLAATLSSSHALLTGDDKSPSSALASNPTLPPRPPPQEKPASHPNYAPGDDIRSYHPHSQQAGGSSFRAQSGAPPALTVGANGLPPPPAASFQSPATAAAVNPQPQSPATPGHRQKDATSGRADKEDSNDDDVPWAPEVQKLYDDFLRDERVYVTEGQWDKFPPNSRLFIGASRNLAGPRWNR